MRLHGTDLKASLEKAREIREQYELYVLAGKDQTQRSMDDLLLVVEEYLGKKIKVSELQLNHEGRSIKGMYLLVKDNYEIYLLAGLPDDLRRFVFCKEIFHILIDCEETRSIDLVKHLDELEVTISVDDVEPSKAAACEELAGIAAMEFLFPYAERVMVLNRFGNNGASYAVISAEYALPQAVVESYCSPLKMEVLRGF